MLDFNKKCQFEKNCKFKGKERKTCSKNGCVPIKKQGQLNKFSIFNSKVNYSKTKLEVVLFLQYKHLLTPIHTKSIFI